MKVCVTATSDSLEAQVDPRFGRCPYFVFVEPETMRFEAVSNVSAGAMGGAGIQAAQAVANKGVEVVITGRVGPNAFQALSAAGIKIMIGAFGTVRDAIEAYKNGRLHEAVSSGLGTGRGGGMGQDMGRGMGRGRGRGTGQFAPPAYPQTVVSPPPTPAMSAKQELLMLENQMKTLQEQIEQIKESIKKLKK